MGGIIENNFVGVFFYEYVISRESVMYWKHKHIRLCSLDLHVHVHFICVISSDGFVFSSVLDAFCWCILVLEGVFFLLESGLKICVFSIALGDLRLRAYGHWG